MTGCLFVQVASETAAVTLMELCTCEKFEIQQVCNGQVGTRRVKMGKSCAEQADQSEHLEPCHRADRRIHHDHVLS
jgi:hypothetical protein